MPVPRSSAYRARRRRARRAVAATALVLPLLAACSDSKKPAASASSSAAHSAFSSSAPPTSVASASSSVPAPSSRSDQTPALVGCDLFSVPALDSATGRTWNSSKKTRSTECKLVADNGNVVDVGIHPISGSDDQAYTNSQIRCDAGTDRAVDVGDGGYVCDVEGGAVAGLLVRSKHVTVTLTPSGFGAAPVSEVEAVLTNVLHAFVAPS